MDLLHTISPEAFKQIRDADKLGAGHHFLRPNKKFPECARHGDRVYCNLGGQIVGFWVIEKIFYTATPIFCLRTGRSWEPAKYVMVSARSWRELVPIRTTVKFPWRPFDRNSIRHEVKE